MTQIRCRHYGRHYTRHGFETFAIHIQMCGLVFLITVYAVAGFKKVEIAADRSKRVICND